MKNKKRLIFGIILVAALAFLAYGCTNALKDAASLQTYDFGTDQVATVNSVVGDRTVSGMDVGTENGNSYQQYTYSSDSVLNDLIAYSAYLRNNGWTATQDYDFSAAPGSTQMAIVSADSGLVLVMDISFESNDFTIKVTKEAGTLTTN